MKARSKIVLLHTSYCTKALNKDFNYSTYFGSIYQCLTTLKGQSDERNLQTMHRACATDV